MNKDKKLVIFSDPKSQQNSGSKEIEKKNTPNVLQKTYMTIGMNFICVILFG